MCERRGVHVWDVCMCMGQCMGMCATVCAVELALAVSFGARRLPPIATRTRSVVWPGGKCRPGPWCTVLFPPLTGVEAVGARVEGKTLIVSCKLSVNLRALELQDVLSKRRKGVRDMGEAILSDPEVYAMSEGPQWKECSDLLQPARSQDVLSQWLRHIGERHVDFCALAASPSSTFRRRWTTSSKSA